MRLYIPNEVSRVTPAGKSHSSTENSGEATDKEVLCICRAVIREASEGINKQLATPATKPAIAAMTTARRFFRRIEAISRCKSSMVSRRRCRFIINRLWDESVGSKLLNKAFNSLS